MEDSKASPSSVARAPSGGAAPAPKKNRAELMARVQWGIGLGVTAFVMAMSAAGMLERLEYPALDINAKTFTSFSPPPDPRLVMIGIDDPSQTTVGKWPWPRELLARVIRELHREGAGVIAMDLLLNDPQPAQILGDISNLGSLRLVDGDAELASAISEHGHVVLGGAFNIEASEDKAKLGRGTSGLKLIPMAEIYRQVITRPDISDEELRKLLLPEDADKVGGAAIDDLNRKAAAARLLYHRLDDFSVPVPAETRAWPASAEPDPPVARLLAATAKLATVSFGNPDSDGTVRRIPMWVRQEGRLYPTLGLASSALLLGVEKGGIRIEANYTVVKLPSGKEIRLRMHRAPLQKLGTVDGLYYVSWPRGGGWEQQFIDKTLVEQYQSAKQERESRRGAGAGPERFGLPKLDGGKLGIKLPAITATPDTTADVPPGTDLPIGKLLDPYLSGLRIKANVAETDTKLLYLSDPRFMGNEVSLIDDREAYRKRSDALASLDPDDPQWRAAYEQHHKAWIAAVDNAAFVLESFAGTPAEKLGEREVVQRDNTAAFLTKIYQIIPEIDTRLEDIATLRQSLSRRVAGKLCLIGWTGTGVIADFVQTSIDARTPGVYVHGAMANTIFTSYARTASGTAIVMSSVTMQVLLGLIGTLIGVRLGVVVGPIVLLISIASCFVLSGWIVWDGGSQVATFAAPLLCGIASWLAVLLHRLLVEQRGRKQTEARFRSYVSPDVVDILVNNPELQSMAPTRRELTIMFSDVANWTTLTERLGTEGIYKFLSKYLGEMTDIIQRNKATLDKYLGDGIMAFWGAPIEDPDHAKNAAIACVEMVKRLDEMNRKGEFGDAGTVEVRFGIATGEVNVGDFGNPPHKSAYTVIGDAVNLSARLESSNKQFGTSILMTKRVVDLSRAEVLFRPIGRIVVKGKTEYEELFELIGDRQPKGERTREWIDLTNQAISAYQKGDLDAAEAAFHRMADDFDDGKLAKLYLHAIDDLRKSGIPEGWEGTLVLTEK